MATNIRIGKTGVPLSDLNSSHFDMNSFTLNKISMWWFTQWQFMKVLSFYVIKQRKYCNFNIFEYRWSFKRNAGKQIMYLYLLSFRFFTPCKSNSYGHQEKNPQKKNKPWRIQAILPNKKKVKFTCKSLYITENVTQWQSKLIT